MSKVDVLVEIIEQAFYGKAENMKILCLEITGNIWSKIKMKRNNLRITQNTEFSDWNG